MRARCPRAARMGQELTEAADHGITGDVLVRLDHELLKDIGVTSLGKRLKVLKAVYQMKIVEEIPMEEGDWIPPCTSRILFTGAISEYSYGPL